MSDTDLEIHAERDSDELYGALDELAIRCNDYAAGNGFYEEDDRIKRILSSDTMGDSQLIDWFEATVTQAAIARIHSEASEWLEEVRDLAVNLNKSEKCPDLFAVEEEAADVIIRVLDTCERNGYRIGAAVKAKMAYNNTRPRKHGKNS